MSLTRYGRILLPILLAVLMILALGAALTVHLSRTVADDTAALLHAHAITDKARALLAQLERSEAAQRVHMVGGDAGALSAFEQAGRAAEDLSRELTALTSASPRQRVRSDYLKAQTTVRRELLQRGADAAKTQGFGARHAAVSREGQELMAVIRTTVDEIVADENAAVVRRIEAGAASERATVYIAIAAAIATFVALMLGALLAARRAHQIRAARRTAVARAAALQKTLDHARDGIAAFDAERRLIAANAHFFRFTQLPERLGAPGMPAEQFCRCAPPGSMPELGDALFAHPDPSSMQKVVLVGGRGLEIWQSRAIDGSLIVSCRPVAAVAGA